jgi:hypothetical protein
MRILGIGIFVAIALAAAFAGGLTFIQKDVAQAYSTSADRLDYQESVNLYGRQADGELGTAKPN